jgi:hypothetical protein
MEPTSPRGPASLLVETERRERIVTLVATLHVRLPILRRCVERAPGVDLTLEEQTMTAAGSIDVTLRAEGEGTSALEAELDADETVSRWIPVGETDTARLYRVRFTAAASAATNYHEWTDGRAIFLPARPTGDGWTVTAYLPDRSVLHGFVSGCEANGV